MFSDATPLHLTRSLESSPYRRSCNVGGKVLEVVADCLPLYAGTDKRVHDKHRVSSNSLAWTARPPKDPADNDQSRVVARATCFFQSQIDRSTCIDFLIFPFPIAPLLSHWRSSTHKRRMAMSQNLLTIQEHRWAAAYAAKHKLKHAGSPY